MSQVPDFDWWHETDLPRFGPRWAWFENGSGQI